MDKSLWQTFGSFDIVYPLHTRVVISSNVMWEILHNSADWHYSKILISQGILKIQIQVRGECVLSAVTHLFPQVWCVRSKLQFHSAQKSLKLSHLIHVCAWMEVPLGICGILFLQYYSLPPTKFRATWLVPNNQGNTSNKTTSQTHKIILMRSMSIMLLQTQNILVLAPRLISFRIMKQWARWSLKAEARRWDTRPAPTELRLICYVTGSTLTQRTKSKTFTPNTNSQTY